MRGDTFEEGTMETRLFVGNLTAATVEADLRAAFAAAGFEIAEVEMAKDPESGRPRGFAFVRLASAEAVPGAIERMDRSAVDGRAISVRVIKDQPFTYRPPLPPPAAPAEDAPVPKQVLVVEDDPDVREATSMALVEAGYSVVAASSGRAAIDQLMMGSCRPTTILLDLTMPIMDGREFMTELQRLPAHSSVGVVLTSGQDDLGDVAAALGAGGYLRKPIGLDQLTAMVAALDRRVSGLLSHPGLADDPPHVAEGAKGDIPAI
jgi:CheY-like chemotaxis protein